jgi:hypothetical protein
LKEQWTEQHEVAWKEYGCTNMFDGWTDTSHRHLINFLANSPAGTFFLGLVDAFGVVANNANMLADLLEKHIDIVGRQHVNMWCSLSQIMDPISRQQEEC